jgi:hypothetical protein
MICWHDIDQGSDEWYANRLGRATASNFHLIMANEGRAFGEPAKKYAEKIAIESITHRQAEAFTNDWMERGKELEPVARQLYVEKNLESVTNGGMFISDCGRFSCSPDGIVAPGGVEIKCVKYNTHFAVLKSKSYDTGYKWQIHGEIWLGELDWVDFISYCPEFPENKQLYIFRVMRDEEIITRLKSRLEDFWVMVKENKKILEDED